MSHIWDFLTKLFNESELVINSETLDVWSHIAIFIDSDKDKCHLMITCKKISKCNFYFNEIICIEKIIGTAWFDRFTNIETDDLSILPRYLTHLKIGTWTFSYAAIFGDVTNYDFNGKIPLTVTHLTFPDNFNQKLDDCIPSSVIYINFGFNFDHPIKDRIPTSVTEITFGGRFNQMINKNIPSSVTKLNFTKYHIFRHSIFENLPSSIKKVTVTGTFHELERRDIYHSIIGLEFIEGDWIEKRDDIKVRFYDLKN